MKLIDKDALVAEIERRKQVALGWMETAPNDAVEAEFELCDDILSFLNTLEVTEVDLEKEIREEYLKRRCYGGRDNMLVILNEPQFNMIAKYFFELGVNASNPLTWEDVKTIFLLVQVEWCPNKNEEEIYQEVLKRFKEKKGE